MMNAMLLEQSKSYTVRCCKRESYPILLLVFIYLFITQPSCAGTIDQSVKDGVETSLTEIRYQTGKETIYQIFTNNFSLAADLRVVTAPNHHLYLENEKTGKRWYPFVGKNEFGMEFARSGNLHKFAAGSLAGEAIQWDGVTGQYDFVKGGVVDRIIHLSYKDNGSLMAIGSQGDDLYLWNITSGQKSIIMGDITSAYMALADSNFDNGGNTLVVASAKGVFGFWNDDGYREVTFTEVDSWDLLSLTLSPDGENITVSLDSGGIISWSLDTLEKKFSITRYSSLVHNMAYFADGRVLVLGLESGEVIFLDSSNGDELGALGPLNDTIMGLHYDQNDGSLYIASAGGPDTFLTTLTLPEEGISTDKLRWSLELLFLEHVVRQKYEMQQQDERTTPWPVKDRK